MPTIQNDSQQDMPQFEMNAVAETARGPRLLSPDEIKAIAGGPEGSVGSGMSPP